MSSCPKTREFSAWINLMPGSDPKLIVAGQVETSASNMHPKLMETIPQGINPQILLLTLTIEETGDLGTQNIAYRPARFDKPAERGQYSQVEISFDGESCLTLDVTEAS